MGAPAAGVVAAAARARAAHGAARRVGLAAVGVLVLLVGFVTVLAGRQEQDCGPPGGQGSVKALPAVGSIEGLDADQLRNAQAVIEAGRRSGVSDRGIVVALATALQESRLRNYANDGTGGDLGADQRGIGSSLRLPHEAVGTDHGSIGIMQQQWPWWGSMRELMDPATAAAKFYASLLRVRGWESMPVTVAAQTVQRSAYPAAYADDEDTAEDLLAKIGSVGEHGEGGGGSTIVKAVAGGPRYNLGAVKPQLTALVGVLGPRFGITTVGGYRASARDPAGHPSGLAADFMTSSQEQGDRLAGFAQQHAGELGVDYVIWRQRIWSAGRAGEGWRAMEDRGGRTENHFDHVHVNVLPTANAASITTLQGTLPAVDQGMAGDDCEEVPAVADRVVFPLPAGTAYTDLRNWGGGGSRWAREHTGTDLSVGCGTPVLAAHAGTVEVDRSQSWAGRWLVKVSTGPGAVTTWYAHMQALTVASGQQVRPGQQIGEVGAEGNASGCHLHLEVHPHGGSIYQDDVNPSAWLGRWVGRSLGGGSTGGVLTAAAAGAAPPAGNRVTVMSWNVRFGQFGVAAIAEAIRSYNPDIIGLNEVDAFPARGYAQARDLAQRLGMYMAYGPNKTWGRSKQRGNAILSRWPLSRVSNTRLPVQQGREPRGLLHALVDLGGRTVSVYVTHLDFGGQVRQAQAGAVAAAVGVSRCPTWLLGDMNFAPRGNPGMYRTLTRTLVDPYASGAYGRGATAPAPNPRGRIDYVLHAGATTVAAQVMPRGPSDHRAVRTVNVVPMGASCA